MGEESKHLVLNVHRVRGRVYWSAMERRGMRQVVIARGFLDDPYPAEVNVVGSLLMEAAYAAHKLIGDFK